MQFTYKAYAYADTTYTNVDSYLNGELTPLLSDSKPGSGGYYERQGYPCIGEATVTVEVSDQEEMIRNQVAGLKKQLEAVRAASLEKENQILLQISKLQALEFAA